MARARISAYARPPWADMASGLIVDPLQQGVTADVRPALTAIFGAVLFLVGIACVNVTNLVAARGLNAGTSLPCERRSEQAAPGSSGTCSRRAFSSLAWAAPSA